MKCLAFEADQRVRASRWAILNAIETAKLMMRLHGE